MYDFHEMIKFSYWRSDRAAASAGTTLRTSYGVKTANGSFKQMVLPEVGFFSGIIDLLILAAYNH